MDVLIKGVQCYLQRAGVGAGFNSNQAGAPADSTCLITYALLFIDAVVASALLE